MIAIPRFAYEATISYADVGSDQLLSYRGALRLLQRLRDEAHRFANNYNELLVRRRVRESRLDAYPGMTTKRKELLLARFRTLPNLRTRTAEEVAELPGISRAWAEKFCEWLRNS